MAELPGLRLDDLRELLDRLGDKHEVLGEEEVEEELDAYQRLFKSSA